MARTADPVAPFVVQFGPGCWSGSPGSRHAAARAAAADRGHAVDGTGATSLPPDQAGRQRLRARDQGMARASASSRARSACSGSPARVSRLSARHPRPANPCRCIARSSPIRQLNLRRALRWALPPPRRPGLRCPRPDHRRQPRPSAVRPPVPRGGLAGDRNLSRARRRHRLQARTGASGFELQPLDVADFATIDALAARGSPAARSTCC